jgi:type IV pilus assembly protein PilV
MKLPHKSATHGRLRGTGFSLVEVMVALIVISVGLLGIAKMQALALSNTSTSRMRSLIALEAASLASTMRADRAYWSSPALWSDPKDPMTVTIAAGGAVTSTDATAQPPPPASNVCNSSCTPPQLAMSDLQAWGLELNSIAPSATSVVTCTPPPAAAPFSTPVSCRIFVSWTESLVASNAQQALQQQPLQGQQAAPPPITTYTIYVDP